MRTRIKALVAVVIATAAIGGALAAPASADAPFVNAFVSCEGGNPTSLSISGPLNLVRRHIAFWRQTCDPATANITIVGVP
jgi:hypothetical protein